MYCTLLFIAALAGLGCCQSLTCYGCNGDKHIKGVDLTASVQSFLEEMPKCTKFNPSKPDPSFLQRCPMYLDVSCIKITDPTNSSNQIRGCYTEFKEGGCIEPFCYCNTDKCNGAGRGWPSAVLLLLAAVLAALVGAV